MSLVVLQLVGQLALVAESGVVERSDTRNPVAVLIFTKALNVVLAAGKVPHEVTPVHEVQLVGKEEAEVFPLRRHHHGVALAVGVRTHHGVSLDAAQPGIILVRILVGIHTREEHVLGKHVFAVVAHYLIAVGFRGVGLFVTLDDGAAL